MQDDRTAGRRPARSMSGNFRNMSQEVCLHQRAVVEEAPPGFNQMGLSQTMLRALKKVGYHTPSPIQAEFIPEAMDGVDIIGQAKSGTGKTAAFAIPLIEMLEPRGR